MGELDPGSRQRSDRHLMHRMAQGLLTPSGHFGPIFSGKPRLPGTLALFWGVGEPLAVLFPAESERPMIRDIHWVDIYSSTVIKHFIELTPKVTK